jgi:hypothetical protein
VQQIVDEDERSLISRVEIKVCPTAFVTVVFVVSGVKRLVVRCYTYSYNAAAVTASVTVAATRLLHDSVRATASRNSRAALSQHRVIVFDTACCTVTL